MVLRFSVTLVVCLKKTRDLFRKRNKFQMIILSCFFVFLSLCVVPYVYRLHASSQAFLENSGLPANLFSTLIRTKAPLKCSRGR